MAWVQLFKSLTTVSVKSQQSLNNETRQVDVFCKQSILFKKY
jgi:hypothetical protein